MFRVTATQPSIVIIRAHTTSCLLSVSDIEEYTLYQPL